MSDTHPLPPTANMAERLEICAQKAGGKRALAKAAGISEAQLFRYLKGDSDIAVSKLTAIAGAAKVDTAWLLTGEGQPIVVAAPTYQEPPFNPHIMETLTREMEALLIEYQQRLNPEQRARALTFLYQALRHDELTHGHHTPIDRRLLLNVLEFYDHFRNEDMLDIIRHTWQNPYNRDTYVQAQFCSAIMQGLENEYEGMSGQRYFQRMTFEIPAISKTHLSHLLELTQNRFPQHKLSLLDIGAGNGRELSFVFQHFPNVQPYGLELSQRGINISKKLELTGKLPPQCLQQGNATNLPYNDNFFHSITSRMTLNWIPYIPQSNIGLSAVFQEMQRVLKPQGLLSLTLPMGEHRYYTQFNQPISHNMLEELTINNNLTIISITPIENIKSPYIQTSLQDTHILLEKK